MSGRGGYVVVVGGHAWCGGAWQGVCMLGGMCGRGALQGACMLGDMHGREACVAGGVWQVGGGHVWCG